jgi:hypothetical protein
MRIFLSFFFCILVGLEASAYAQTSATGIPYFQQHVHYTLAATFNDDLTSPSIDGTGNLLYTNNSPDTLHELYFHLYWNLFKSGSYGESAPNRDHDPDSKYGHGGIDIKSVTTATTTQVSSDNIVTVLDTNIRYEIDNTIMRIFLKSPILPGETCGVGFSWHGLLPNYGIRSTWGWHDDAARNFATAQWYPQVCVYDNHGWHPDQYIGMGEFYTDYGVFDVSLTLPDRFTTVVSTGWQTNPEETTPDSVLERLAFAKAHPDSIVRIADYSGYQPFRISKGPPTRTWKFHADSVRDFAWCADEAYIRDAVYDNGIMHNALYWGNSRDFWSKEAAKIELLTIQTNSKFAGQYMYPNVFMCETYEGGMEYPGIVFIGPYSSGEKEHWAQNTMMHELGHQWYPMMMGSNETDYGYMDEGFNTFITTFVHEKYFGRWNNSYGPGLGYNDDERTANYREAILQQLSGNQESTKQKADMYYSYRDYADATYPHPSSVFFMLRYTMGDTAFADFMKLYYERWRFKHPYPDDLENAAEDIERREGDTNRVRARGDLRWFFNEWFEQTWKLDYAVGGFSVAPHPTLSPEGEREYDVKVTIDRKERAVMPLDLVFTFDDGTTEQKWIPVDDWLRTVADERTYSYTFAKHPVKVQINPSLELLDVNRLNNTSSWIPPLDVHLVPRFLGDEMPVDAYAVRSVPLAVPQTFDFTQWALGWTVLGSYLNRNDRIAIGIREYTTDLNLDPGWVLQYHNVLDWLSPWTDLDIAALLHDENEEFFGIQMSQNVDAPGSTTPKHIFNAGYDLSGYILSKQPNTYNPDGSRVAPIPLLNRVTAGYTYYNKGTINEFSAAAGFEAGVGDPRTIYSKLSGTMNDRLQITSDWSAFVRVFGGSMQPIGENLPSQSLFQLASASNVDQLTDVYASNFGSGVRDKIRNPTMTGPLVRGYLDDVNPEGRVAASGTFELGNRSLFPFSFLSDIPYAGQVFDMFGLSLFGDAGFVTNVLNRSDLPGVIESDLGLGLRFFGFNGSSDRAGTLDLDRSEIQVDFPIYLDKPEAGDSKLEFRIVGIVRQDF